ncbi:extracellular solute-binding protein [Paenibacillus thalictri]|uniref:Extracellular solute-binding protein n=1 Tax=Paenibacillus thalictri TaxID=2527873 RepID=A0A4Q9DG80_9BACL|nr:extracellular solute-binding protein [Paenibacillus thalictri]TBL70568.1 extracellular solute-binding protein [Paenibacillus thalictri]
MRHFRKRGHSISVSALAVLMTGTLLAGCAPQAEPAAPAAPASDAKASNTQPQPAKTGDAAAPAAKSSGPVTLDIIESAAALPAADADFIKQALEKALNVNLNLTSYTALNDYVSQLNVRVAGGNSPDLFQVTDRGQLAQLADQGQLLDLTPYVAKLDKVKKFLGDDNLKKGYYNGKLYAVPKQPVIDYWTYWIRKDWLDKLNLQVPTTVDELLQVAKAFTENDPDGNGKKDTFGITGGGGGGAQVFGSNPGVATAFAPVFGAYGVGLPGSIYSKGGKMVDAYHDPAMKDAIQSILKFTGDKVVDPDLAANNGLQHQQKAIQGQVGIVYIDWANISKDQFADQIKSVNPNAQWVQMSAPKGPGGQFDGTWDSGTTPMLLGLSKSLEKNPEKLQKVIDLLNYVADGDGLTLVQYGIKDKHYTLEGGKPKPTDLLGKEGGYIWSYQFVGRPELEYLQGRFDKQAKYIDFTNKQPRIQALNGYVDIPKGYNKADAERYASEEFLKFVYNKRPLGEYDDFLKTLDGQFGYKAYMDGAAAQLQTLGVLK